MFVELTKGEHTWFCKFLNNFIRLKKSHVLNGIKVSDKIMDKIEDIVSIDAVKGGTFIVHVNKESATFLVSLLEECMFCCPGCSVSSVKHRSAILAKLYTIIEQIEKEKDEKRK